MSFYEPNPDIVATGAEAGEFADDGPLTADDDPDDEVDADPTRRPSGSPPLAE
jgi:hypothetical protein